MFPAMFSTRVLFRVRLGLDRLEATRWLMLAGVGAASLAIYWLAFVSPFSLKALGLRPHVDIAQLTRGKPAMQIELALAYAALLALYYLAWRICRRPARSQAHAARSDQRLWAVLIATIAAINLAMISLYPIGAVDVFDYIAQGREISIWHANPFYQPANYFAWEPVLKFTGWSAITTLYGPAWQLIAAPVTWLAGSDLRLNLLSFKSLAVLFYAGCCVLIGLILRRQGPERARAAVCLFALNPLVIYETAGNAHNDIVMVFCLLLGVYFLSRERHSLAALALTLGALVKFVPGFLLPAALVYSLCRLPGWRARLQFLGRTSLACGLLAAAVVGPFWRGGDMFATRQRLSMLTSSLPAWAEALLQPRLGAALAEQWVGRVTLWLTAAAVAATVIFVWRRTRRLSAADAPWLPVAQAGTAFLLFYLLVAVLWFQGWYALWPLSLAVLLPEGGLLTSALVLSVAGIWKPLYLDDLLNRTRLTPRLVQEAWLGPMVLGANWLLAVVTLGRWARRAK